MYSSAWERLFGDLMVRVKSGLLSCINAGSRRS